VITGASIEYCFELPKQIYG